MKILTELWGARGDAPTIKVSDNVDGVTETYTILGIMPDGDFIGYDSTNFPTSFYADSARFTLVIDKPKPPRLQAWVAVSGTIYAMPEGCPGTQTDWKRLPGLDALINEGEEK